MSFKLIRKSLCNWIEYTQSSEQTISSGTDIIWDTVRSTSTPSMSIDSSTGVITLDSNKRYWIQANINILRSGNGGFEFKFLTGAGGSLSQSDGSFPILYVEDTSKPITNSSLMASLMVSYPTSTYKLQCIDIDANSTLKAQSHLFIMEML